MALLRGQPNPSDLPSTTQWLGDRNTNYYHDDDDNKNHNYNHYNNNENHNHYSYFKYFEYKDYLQRFVEFMNVSLECENRKKLLLKRRVLRNVPDWRDCRNSCNDLAECVYFNYDKKRKTCSLIRTLYKASKNFVSGPKYCDL